MHVGLLGPATTAGLVDWLDGDPAHLPAGNGGTPVTLLAAALLELGHDVTLWTLTPEIAAPVVASGARLRVHYLPQRPGGRGRDAYAAERRHLRHALDADAHEVDVLHAQWTYEYALAALRRPEPLLVTVHDWAPTILRYQPDPYRLVRLLMQARTFAARPPLITVSPYLERHLRRWRLPVAAVIPNGVPPAWIAPAARRRGEGLALVTVADGFAARKNTTAVLRAVGHLRADGLPVTLTLVGADHEPGGAAASWARRHGLHDGVTFAGRRPHREVRDLLDHVDLLVHPAREESFGMVLIEAMARGLPVVAGRASGAVPWVVDRAGALVDVEDPTAIARAVRDLLLDPDRYQRAAAAAHARARDRFAMPVIASQHLDVYHRVAERHRGR